MVERSSDISKYAFNESTNPNLCLPSPFPFNHVISPSLLDVIPEPCSADLFLGTVADGDDDNQYTQLLSKTAMAMDGETSPESFLGCHI